MWDDPIVAEVRHEREKLAAQFSFDVKAIFADMRRRQAALGGRLVSQKERAEPTDAVDRDRPRGNEQNAIVAGGPGN